MAQGSFCTPDTHDGRGARPEGPIRLPSVDEAAALSPLLAEFNRRSFCAGLAALVAASSTGCRNLNTSLRPRSLQPPVLPDTATGFQITNLVNENTRRVNSLYAPQATITGPGMPRLGAMLAFERPQNFRLQAKFLGSTQVDMGSNSDLFWLWSEQTRPPALLYARHQEFRAGQLSALLPVDIHWLTDALGLVTFAPTDEHSDPIPVGNGLLKITTRLRGPAGESFRVVVFSPRRGEIVQQVLFDGQQTKLAGAQLRRYRKDPTSGANLPTEIEIDWPTAGRSFTIDLGEPEVNAQLTQLSQTMWDLPQVPGSALVDLGNPAQMAAFLQTNGG